MIQSEFAEIRNRAGGKAGSLKIVDSRERLFHFVFTDRRETRRLQTGALYALVAGFRWMVEETPEGTNWKILHPEQWVHRFNELGPEVVAERFVITEASPCAPERRTNDAY